MLQEDTPWRSDFKARIVILLQLKIDSLPLLHWLIWLPGEEALLDKVFRALGESVIKVLPNTFVTLLLEMLNRSSSPRLFLWIVEAIINQGNNAHHRLVFDALCYSIDKQSGQLSATTGWSILASTLSPLKG